MKKRSFKKLSAILAVAMIITAIAPLSAQAAVGDKFTVGNLEFKVDVEASGATPGEVLVNVYKATGGEVVIPDTVASGSNIYTVTGINGNVFRGKSIISVRIPSTIKVIGDTVFLDCSSLTNVAFEPGSKLARLGSIAFAGCTSLVSIDLPDGLKTIPLNAFAGCTSLKSVNLPYGLEYIYDNAFYKCSSLNEIIFNSPIRPGIGYDVLRGIAANGVIYYPANGTWYNDRFFNELFGGPVPQGWSKIAGRPPKQPGGSGIEHVNMSADVPKADVPGFGREFSVSGEITNAPGIPESVKLNANALSPEFTSNKAANAAYSDALLYGQPVAFNALEIVDAANGGVFALPEGVKARLKFELGKAYADKAITISQYDVNGALIGRFNVTCDGEGSAVINANGLGLFVITREWLG